MYIPDTCSQSGKGRYLNGTSYDFYTDNCCVQPLLPLHLYIIKLVSLSLYGNFCIYKSILILTE